MVKGGGQTRIMNHTEVSVKENTSNGQTGVTLDVRTNLRKET